MRLRRLSSTLVLSAVSSVAALSLAVAAPHAPRRTANPQLRLASATGGLGLSNSRPGAAILSGEGMRPGGQTAGTVRIGNTGDVAGALTLQATLDADVAGTGGGHLSDRLQLRVLDVTHPERPVDVYGGRLALMGRVALGDLGAGEARTYLFVATLPAGGVADDAWQGARFSAGFEWTATASSPPEPAPEPAPPAPAPPEPAPPAPAPPEPAPPAPAPEGAPPAPLAPQAPSQRAGGGEVAGVSAERVVSLPATRRCESRRKFSIRVNPPAGVTLRSVTVFVNGRRAATGNARGAPTNLSGLPAGRVSVKVVAVPSTGAPIVLQRTYTTCVAKRRKG